MCQKFRLWLITNTDLLAILASRHGCRRGCTGVGRIRTERTERTLSRCGPALAPSLGFRHTLLAVFRCHSQGAVHDQCERKFECDGTSSASHPRSFHQRRRSEEIVVLVAARSDADLDKGTKLLAPSKAPIRDSPWRTVRCLAGLSDEAGWTIEKPSKGAKITVHNYIPTPARRSRDDFTPYTEFLTLHVPLL